MANDYDLIILSHHKCATNWLRGICKVLADENEITVDVVGGKKKGPENRADSQARHVLLNVNANRRAMDDLHEDPSRNIHFVRDPRDAFVSNYFSWRYSHETTNPVLADFRQRAETMSVEEGMLDLVELFAMGQQLQGWSDEMWQQVAQIRYEDLLADFDTTARAMFGPSGLDLSDDLLETLRARTSFTKMARRDDGTEDVTSHFRKGKAGDWQNHFTDRLSEAFFAKHGWLGERLGYW